jgi:MYXO-CTERM domain-containing protein
MGPEDLMGGDAYAMWQFGGGNTTVHKNLQYLQAVAADPDAAKALSFFCIHGYDSNGVTAAGANPQAWAWWANGWTTPPAAGIPANVKGYTGYQKKSWMTETSGEDAVWLSPATGFPANGGFSILLKVHQALTTGGVSGWAYWQLSDGQTVGTYTLSDQATGANAPKYVAAKHFFSYVRPGAVRAEATVAGSTSLYASAFVHDANGTLTVILVNADAAAATATVQVPSMPAGITSFDAHTSSNGSYWQPGTFMVSGGAVSVPVPAYGVVSLQGKGQAATPPDAGGAGGASSTGAGGTSGAGASTASSASTSGAGTGGGAGHGTGTHSGCKCGVAGAVDSEASALAALAALVGIARRRRSRALV